MKKWLQKTLIAAVAFLTLGVISPSHEFWTTLHGKDDAKQADQPSIAKSDYTLDFAETVQEETTSQEDLVSAAKEMSYMKFGTKIGPVIETQFDEVIFPKIEEAIGMTLTDADLHKRRLAITERPAGGYAEKIFHVYDKETRKDVIRFHVRTEKRPQDGYFFNFHYHVAEDDYVKHYALGEIYWSKNTPPKWLS
ncbi:YpjP family protein [Sporosarcina sp. HYO08]|uniref:YpjP family protein n=1 Tax=Sporosarcina sp. HYO08 TaxID=1759557 RepID=UPI000794B168|nr:YpjP family protein [Sporosarcina sp. HYO08]KXH81799.1 hypothetical protein AU377_05915 [Sporosarcina sp. HYO08]